MAPRDTRTGGVLEEMVLPALKRGGYSYQQHANIGDRLGQSRRRHLVDVLATDEHGKQWLISLKWQEVTGTAEQKVPFEVISLAHAVHSSQGLFVKAYLVLGGPRWSWRDFYVGGGLNRYLRDVGSVEIINLEVFVARANQGRL